METEESNSSQDKQYGDEINIPYEDFVIGVIQKRIKIEIKQDGIFSKLFFNSFEKKLMMVLLILIFASFIAIPVICYKTDKWILLIGYVGLFFGSVVKNVGLRTSNPFKNLTTSILTLVLPTSLLIYYSGIFQIFAFIFTCLLYQLFILSLSEILYDKIAKNKLLKNSYNYNLAAENNLIQITFV